MGSRNNPGKFDCYTKAEPDEPMFVLLGRDPLAAALVEFWVIARAERLGEDPEKIAEARACSEAMAAWARGKGKQPLTGRLLLALLMTTITLTSGELQHRVRGLLSTGHARGLDDAKAIYKAMFSRYAVGVVPAKFDSELDALKELRE
jgi:hypothetical protein